jgi:hypothetical protein
LPARGFALVNFTDTAYIAPSVNQPTTLPATPALCASLAARAFDFPTMHATSLIPPRTRAHPSLFRAALPALVLASSAVAQLPSSVVYVEDDNVDKFFAKMNGNLIKDGYNPYDRTSVPAAALAKAYHDAKESLTADASDRAASDAVVVQAANSTRDSSAQDISELLAFANKASPSPIRPTSEPARAAAASGNFTVVGYGQATTGFNFRALIATGQIGSGTSPSTNLVSQAVTGFPASAVNTFLTGVAANGTAAVGVPLGRLMTNGTLAVGLTVV